jgi:hypothetical protein
MTELGSTGIRLEPQQTLLIAQAGTVVVAAGVAGLADTVFRHHPPTPAEMEQAIDIVEDALMATRVAHAARGELETSDPLLQALPGLSDEGSRLTRDEVEALFQRLASSSLGHPGAAAGLPAGGPSAAALLILRELMHHLGYAAVRCARARRES